MFYQTLRYSLIFPYDQFQVHIWDTSSSQLVQRLPAGGVVVDTCTLRLNQQTYLAALTEKNLKVYRWC